MAPILLLTKNLIVEKCLQEKIQYLNYEVFCSSEILEQLLWRDRPNQEIARNYRAVIFSENISNEETELLISRLGMDPKKLFRKLSGVPDHSEEEALIKLGIRGIWETQPVSYLRELLAPNKIDEGKQASAVTCETHDNQLLKSINIQAFLTDTEYRIFGYLMDRRDKVISRKDAISFLWEESVSPSRLSQLSSNVQNINRKFSSRGFGDQIIVSAWGKGYHLSAKFLELCEDEDKQRTNAVS